VKITNVMPVKGPYLVKCKCGSATLPDNPDVEMHDWRQAEFVGLIDGDTWMLLAFDDEGVLLPVPSLPGFQEVLLVLPQMRKDL
jgi:hypothetical protein